MRIAYEATGWMPGDSGGLWADTARYAAPAVAATQRRLRFSRASWLQLPTQLPPSYARLGDDDASTRIRSARLRPQRDARIVTGLPLARHSWRSRELRRSRHIGQQEAISHLCLPHRCSEMIYRYNRAILTHRKDADARFYARTIIYEPIAAL